LNREGAKGGAVAWFDHLPRTRLRSARRPAPPAEASIPPVPSRASELPVITTSPPDTRPAPPRLAWLVATACGAGLSPIAPGTAGSAVGVALFLLVFAVFPLPLFLLSVAALIALGVWAADAMQRATGTKDDPRIVIDEVAGQLLALAPLVALGRPKNFFLVVTGFVLFRVFDVWKPGPVRRLEAWPGGAGVVMDDVLAGVFAGLGLAALALVAERVG